MSNKTISILTAILVGSLAIAAFVLSYSALRDLAADNGISETLSYIWPLPIDVSLIVFSLAVVRNSLQGERTLYPWALVTISTMALVGFGILHAPIAALSLLAAFLLFVKFISSLRRNHHA